MKLLDRYILKQFLSTFFFVLVILMSVITVIDLTDKMDKFARAGVTGSQIAGYYVDYVSWVGGFITPIIIFIATVYVCARMAGRTEIIAILSSGTSFMRFVAPFMIGAGVVAALSFFLNGWVIPNSNKTRLAFDVQYLKSKFYFDKRNIHIQVAPEVYLYLQSYNNTIHTGYNFTMERFSKNKLIEKMTGSRIEWDSTKQKWRVEDYKIKRIDVIFGVDSTQTDSLSTDTTTLNNLVRPREANLKLSRVRTVPESATNGVVVASGSSIDTALVIHPKEFESDYRRYEGMTMTELTAHIKTLKDRGAAGVEVYQVEKYTRYSAPFTIFILVFMGVIVSSRKSRGGTGLQIALGFALSFIFILFFMLFRTFAENGQWPPQISVWVPNITFALISLAMYKYVPR